MRLQTRAERKKEIQRAVQRTTDGDVHPDAVKDALLSLRPHIGLLIGVVRKALEEDTDDIASRIVRDTFFERDTTQSEHKLHRNEAILDALVIIEEANMEQMAKEFVSGLHVDSKA